MAQRIAPSSEEGEAAELLSDLVRIDSRNPPGKERACAEFVRDWLADNGVESRFVHEPFEDRPQVVAEIGEGRPGTRTLVLNGHMDVVSPGDVDDWTHEPFGGELEDGKVYGRGTSDMKAGLAAGMLAARAAAESDALDGRLVLAFAVGEETGEPGTLRLIEDLDADFGVVLEPTELVVDTACKGLAWYDATIKGSQGHASKPFLCENAIEGVFAAGPPIQEYQERIAEREHELLGESICTPTVCVTEETQNVIPGQAQLRFDRRFLPSETPAQLDEEIDAAFDPVREAGFDVDVSRTKLYEAVEIPTDAEIAEVVRRHASDVAGIDTSPHGKIAATDQRFFVDRTDIPAIVWGPGSPSQAHTVDEWARVDLLEDAVPILCRTIEELLVE